MNRVANGLLGARNGSDADTGDEANLTQDVENVMSERLSPVTREIRGTTPTGATTLDQSTTLERAREGSVVVSASVNRSLRWLRATT